MATQYNLRSPAVKRLMREAEELREATVDYYAQPLEDNLFEWHFTVRGPSDSDFESGIYHGRITLPTEYPMKPPSIIILTPNGRFETNKKICLSISGYHPESWQPSWSIRTALLAIIGFMPTEGLGAIGSLDFPPEQRRKLAVKSQTWSCPSCGIVKNLLKDRSERATESKAAEKDRELAKQICFKNEDKAATEATNPKKPECSEDIAEATSSDPSLNSPIDHPGDPAEVDGNSTKAELRQRTIPSAVANTPTAAAEHSPTEEPSAPLSQPQQQEAVNLNMHSSGPHASTYLIIFLSIALAFLIFRRLFLLD